MKTSKVLPVSFLALMMGLGALTVATAQSTTEETPESPNSAVHVDENMRVDSRKPHGDRREGGHHGMIRQILKKVDADGDRAVTQGEIDTYRAGLVTTADTSGEGDISLDEFQTIYLELFRNQMVDAFQNLDEDGDGAVTQAEMDEKFGDFVERMDRNGDEKLDREDRGGRGHKAQKRHGEHRD